MKTTIIIIITVIALIVGSCYIFNKSVTSYYVSQYTGTPSTATTKLLDLFNWRLTLLDMKIDSPPGYSVKTAVSIEYFSFKMDFKKIYKGKTFYLDDLIMKNTVANYQISGLNNNQSDIENNVQDYVKKSFNQPLFIKKLIIENMHINFVNWGLDSNIYNIKYMEMKDYTGKTSYFDVFMQNLEDDAENIF